MRNNFFLSCLVAGLLVIALCVIGALVLRYVISPSEDLYTIPAGLTDDEAALYVENPGEYSAFTFTGVTVYESLYEGAAVECEILPFETYTQQNYFNFNGYDLGWRIVELGDCSGFAYKP